MIYHLAYLSGGLRVKGYMSIPPWLELSIAELKNTLSCLYQIPTRLNVEKIASSLHPYQQAIHSVKLPAIVYCRGGIGSVGRVKPHWMEQFSNMGFVVIAPSYRGNEGGEGRDEFGGGENEDVLSAFRLLQSLSFVDSGRITVMGFSRGAINAAQTAVWNKSVYRLILWSGVSDLAQTYEERVDLRKMLKRVIGGTPAKFPEHYRSRSPLHMADQIHCPVLVVHGTQDSQVSFSQGLNMFRALRLYGAEAEIHRYEGLGHHFPLPIHLAAVERMVDWIGILSCKDTVFPLGGASDPIANQP